MGTFFHEGGPGMILTTLMAVPLGISAILTLRQPTRYWAATLVLAVGLAVSGVLGTSVGFVFTLRHVAQMEKGSDLARVMMIGVAESLNNAVLALGILIITFSVCAVAALRALRGRALAAKEGPSNGA